MGRLSRTFSRRFSWRGWPSRKSKSVADTTHSSERFEGDRRQLLQALSAIAGGSALAAIAHPADAKDSSELPPPKRALTGRDAAGKSVFKSFDVTSRVVEIDSNPGLTFYELYRTEGVSALTGLEPDPMATGTKGFPGPGGTIFRLISYPPKRPEGYKPLPGVTFETGVKELSDKLPGMGDHFEKGAPGMHIRYDRLRHRGSRRDDAGIGRRADSASAPGRLHRAERHPSSLAQPAAGAVPDGLHLGRRQARLIRPTLNGAEGHSR